MKMLGRWLLDMAAVEPKLLCDKVVNLANTNQRKTEQTKHENRHILRHNHATNRQEVSANLITNMCLSILHCRTQCSLGRDLVVASIQNAYNPTSTT